MNTYKTMYKRICRLCLSVNATENTTRLTGKVSNKNLSFFGKAVVYLCEIKVRNTDKFPQFICKNCENLLKQTISFKLMCETNDKKLRRLVKMNVKKDQNIKKVISEFALYSQYFPSRSAAIGQKSFSVYKRQGMIKKMTPKLKPSNSQADEPRIETVTLKPDIINDSDSGSDNNDDRDETFADTVPLNQENPDEIDVMLNSIQENVSKLNEPMDITESYNISELRHSKKSESNTFIPITEKQKLVSKEIDKMLDTIHAFINSEKSTYQKKLLKRKMASEIKFVRPKRRDIECKICHRVLANQATYDHHMQRHSVCKYICERCGKGFPVNNELQRHRVNLHGVGPHIKCDHCPFKAPEKKDLVEHMRKHTGERPFTCEKCGLTFRRKAIYRNHLVCHGEKNYKCYYCPMKFYRRYQMVAHCNNIHERKYVYMCKICMVTYTKTGSVRKHMLEKHGIPKEDQGRVVRVMSDSANEPIN